MIELSVKTEDGVKSVELPENAEEFEDMSDDELTSLFFEVKEVHKHSKHPFRLREDSPSPQTIIMQLQNELLSRMLTGELEGETKQ